MYLTIFGSIIAYSAYVALLRALPSSKVSTNSFVNPVVAVALGWLFAGEPVTIYTAVSMALIMISIVGIIKEHAVR
jgi:drug/metabolite transporter (DMT)-like permease